MKMKLPNGRTRQCTLHNVLFVPKLAYNLLSVSRATEAGKVTEFTDKTCQILGDILLQEKIPKQQF